MGERIKVGYTKLEDGSFSKAYVDSDTLEGIDKFTEAPVILYKDGFTFEYKEKAEQNYQIKVTYMAPAGYISQAYVDERTLIGTNKHSDAPVTLKRNPDENAHVPYLEVVPEETITLAENKETGEKLEVPVIWDVGVMPLKQLEFTDLDNVDDEYMKMTFNGPYVMEMTIKQPVGQLKRIIMGVPPEVRLQPRRKLSRKKRKQRGH